MKTFVYRQHSHLGGAVDLDRCRASVHAGGRLVSFHQCLRKGAVEREIDGETYKFCRQHDPNAVAERERARREKWEEEWRRKELRREIKALREDVADAVLELPRSALQELPKALQENVARLKKLMKEDNQ